MKGARSDTASTHHTHGAEAGLLISFFSRRFEFFCGFEGFSIFDRVEVGLRESDDCCYDASATSRRC